MKYLTEFINEKLKLNSPSCIELDTMEDVVDYMNIHIFHKYIVKDDFEKYLDYGESDEDSVFVLYSSKIKNKLTDISYNDIFENVDITKNLVKIKDKTACIIRVNDDNITSFIRIDNDNGHISNIYCTLAVKEIIINL